MITKNIDTNNHPYITPFYYEGHYLQHLKTKNFEQEIYLFDNLEELNKKVNEMKNEEKINVTIRDGISYKTIIYRGGVETDSYKNRNNGNPRFYKVLNEKKEVIYVANSFLKAQLKLVELNIINERNIDVIYINRSSSLMINNYLFFENGVFLFDIKDMDKNSIKMNKNIILNTYDYLTLNFGYLGYFEIEVENKVIEKFHFSHNADTSYKKLVEREKERRVNPRKVSLKERKKYFEFDNRPKEVNDFDYDRNLILHYMKEGIE